MTMSGMTRDWNEGIDTSGPVEIIPGVWWVGFHDTVSGLHCNPYLVVDGDEAVLIDGGSRPDFPTVMLKILQTGIHPSQIRALIYSHYDPDLCGSIPQLEDLIAREDLVIISARPNHMFIRHYAVRSPLQGIACHADGYRFGRGRTLRFIPVPHCHSAGSMLTLDEKTGTLFTGDLFGSYGTDWKLFHDLQSHCRSCEGIHDCPHGRKICPIPGILDFHQWLIPARECLDFAMEQIQTVNVQRIAPQHGSIVPDPEMSKTVMEHLSRIEDIGIEAVRRHGLEVLWGKL